MAKLDKIKKALSEAIRTKTPEEIRLTVHAMFHHMKKLKDADVLEQKVHEQGKEFQIETKLKILGVWFYIKGTVNAKEVYNPEFNVKVEYERGLLKKQKGFFTVKGKFSKEITFEPETVPADIKKKAMLALYEGYIFAVLHPIAVKHVRKEGIGWETW